jgi:hypothetical protein
MLLLVYLNFMGPQAFSWLSKIGIVILYKNYNLMDHFFFKNQR